MERILLIEDNPTTAKSIALFLEGEGWSATSAVRGRDGLERLKASDFDLVMLDLNLPDMDGLSVCEEIRKNKDVPILMLTARSSEEDIVKGLERGAQDYVAKPFGHRELIARVRRLLRDSKKGADEVKLSHGDLVLDRKRWVLTQGGHEILLTRSEFKVLAALMNRPGWVFTRSQLIDIALGKHFDGFDRTIDTHIWSIRKKLSENAPKRKYILSVPGIGYRLAYV